MTKRHRAPLLRVVQLTENLAGPWLNGMPVNWGDASSTVTYWMAQGDGVVEYGPTRKQAILNYRQHANRTALWSRQQEARKRQGGGE